MKSRLFFKIYLTILGNIVILALAGFAAVALIIGSNEARNSYSERAALIAAALPEGGDDAFLQSTLERLGTVTGAELTVLDANGSTLATFRPPTQIARIFDPVTIALTEGRTLTVRLGPPFKPPRGNPLILLIVVSSLAALVAWPMVRHLTRRLEFLRRSVKTWGAGDLSARAPIMGNDEITVVARSFNDAAERVEKLIAANRALLANASHELRSPLARLRMGVELFESDPTALRREEIYRNLEELDTLVGEILLSSRLSHTTSAEPMQPIDLLALVAEESARAGLSVTGSSVEVLGNERLLCQLVRNLIQNATHHGRPPIEITVSHTADHAELAIRDHGMGIAEKDIDRVFEAFFRPGGYSESAGGWGLGLALVRQIAERHSGSVRGEAPSDGGMRFVVTLPRMRENSHHHSETRNPN